MMELMIAAAVQKTSWSWDKLAFNWFDVALVAVLAFGFWRGRKRGMSREFLPVSMWLIIIIAGGFGYEWVGDQLIKQGVIRSVFGKSFLERTAGYLSAYLLIAFLIYLIFSIIKNLLKAKVEGSNTFGSNEYYFGMVAGVIRYASMTIFVLAMLNAPVYSAAEIAAKKAYNKQWFGGGIYDGNYLPDMATVQSDVFQKSLLGPSIKDGLSSMFINANPKVVTPKGSYHN